MHLVYRSSDAYVLLSKSFEPIFRRMAFLPFSQKLCSISYPLTIPLSEQHSEKENVILYLGRLEETQKRVSRVFRIREKINAELSDWRLDIVGDGPDRGIYEKMAKKLERVKFHGFQNPSAYYENAKIMLLTSDFEGFGLVNTEAMSARCVPIVYGSYASVYDIIDTGKDGVILQTPYDEDKFCHAVVSLARDDKMLHAMSENAEDKAKSFTLDAVVKKWLALFERI